MKCTRRWVWCLGCMLALAVAPAPAPGADEATQKQIEELEAQQKRFSEELERLKQQVQQPPPAEEQRVEEVERRQGILTEEIQRLREALYLPETAELTSYYGLGPAASRVYGIKRGLSIGGYGEFNFKAPLSDKNGTQNEFDYVRFVLYAGYKFNDWIVFNSETEFEHATTSSTVSSSGGSVSVEFATLDFVFSTLLDDQRVPNLRAGLILVPLGFLNLLHEPPFYLGNVRPQVELAMIPTTWRANGIGIYGDPLEGFQYQLYGLTSLNAEGFRSNGIRGGRQQGNRELANDWSFAGRLDYFPIEGGGFGGSMFIGDQGQNEDYVNPTTMLKQNAGVFMQLYEIHAQYERYGWWIRALGSTIHMDDADLVSATVGQAVGEDMWGAYVEIAYDLLPLLWEGTTQYLAPWFRYTWLDTLNKVASGTPANLNPAQLAQRRDLYEFGLQYKPIPEVVVKIDYHIQDQSLGTAPDDFRVGAGFIF
jgi:hypothetical protein